MSGQASCPGNAGVPFLRTSQEGQTMWECRMQLAQQRVPCWLIKTHRHEVSAQVCCVLEAYTHVVKPGRRGMLWILTITTIMFIHFSDKWWPFKRCNFWPCATSTPKTASRSSGLRAIHDLFSRDCIDMLKWEWGHDWSHDLSRSNSVLTH